MTGRRWPGRGRRGAGAERGSFTAEFAAGLPAVLLLLLAGFAAVGAVTTKAQCLDAAREGALAASRGEPGAEAAARVAPNGADVTVEMGTEAVTVEVRAPLRVLGGALTVSARAVAAREPSALEGAP